MEHKNIYGPAHVWRLTLAKHNFDPLSISKRGTLYVSHVTNARMHTNGLINQDMLMHRTCVVHTQLAYSTYVHAGQEKKLFPVLLNHFS
jgi:hypothetical protein